MVREYQPDVEDGCGCIEIAEQMAEEREE